MHSVELQGGTILGEGWDLTKEIHRVLAEEISPAFPIPQVTSRLSQRISLTESTELAKISKWGLEISQNYSLNQRDLLP